MTERLPKNCYFEPKGAFYAFPHVDGLTSSRRFAEALLANRDVGVAPGYTFGPDNESHIRICFAQSHARLTDGLTRLVEFARDYPSPSS